MSPAELFIEKEKLAYHFAHKYRTTHYCTLDEIMVEARLGLWEACIDYDSKRGKYSTFAGVCIQNQIRYFLRRERKQKNSLTVMVEEPEEDDEIWLQVHVEERGYKQ